MAKNNRGNRKSPFAAVLALLCALCVMCLLGWGILRLRQARLVRYPVEYVELITQAADENGVPPAFIASIIMAESSYRPEVTSSVGARGLMQIMPETGEWIAGILSEAFSADDLYLPETAIRYGAWYLGFLYDRYEGDLRCAAAAYHAGQGTVDKWLKDPECSEDGRTLTSIPSQVTGTYVNRVLNDYYEYYTREYEKRNADAVY